MNSVKFCFSHRIRHIASYITVVVAFVFATIIVTSVVLSRNVDATVNDAEIGKFAQNGIIFYDPSDCIDVSGTLLATGEWAVIAQAKNAEKSYFNHHGDVESASWGDGNQAEMKRVLETYGDLAYQLGRVIGAPWVAIIVQMRYEDPYSVCGKNNFWGNGCPVSRAYAGGAYIQGKNLGEGFAQYGQSLLKVCSNAINVPDVAACQESLRTSDPKLYLERLGPLWVQGDYNGPGYGSIEGAKKSIDALEAYIATSEGQAIVKTFYNYSDTTSQVTSSSDVVNGNQITWIGDSYSVGAQAQIAAEFPGVDFGSGDPGSTTSYIRSCKFVSDSDTTCNAPNRSCLDILEDVINGNLARQYIVLACGTNGGWSESDITRAKDLVGKIGDSQVIVVTSKVPSSSYTESNQRLKDFASTVDNVTLADWTTVYQDSFFGSDTTHPTANGGYDAWVGVIADAIAEAASGGGCTTFQGEYPQYFQCGESWSSVSYGASGRTICSSGCGAVSMAMLATVATGQDIFPQDIASLLGNQYYYDISIDTLDKKVGDHYGFEVVPVSYSTISDAETKIRDYLQQGYMIHMTGAGCHPGFQNNGVCSKGHLIGIFDIDSNGNVTLANSGYGGNQTFPLHDVVQGIKHGVFTAIRGGSSGRNTCGGLCKSSSVGSIEGGLTEEQAQKIADYYNSSNVDANTLVLGRKDNCVSFSAWFVSTFTGTNLGAWGNGKEVAYNLQTRGGFEGGTEPRPFAVFGVPEGATYCGDSLCGHTGVVVGVDGDDVLVIDAQYNSRAAAVVHKDKSYFTNKFFAPFAYIGDSMDMEKINRIINDE